MKKFSNPLVPLAGIFALLVLGLGVTVGIVVGVSVAGQGISTDAIASDAGGPAVSAGTTKGKYVFSV